MVRFAAICDVCTARSPEYCHWLSCKMCGQDVCPECRETTFDDAETGRSLCKGCYQEELATNEPEDAPTKVEKEHKQ